MLLIGDKVVRNRLSSSVYCHELDLGSAWRELTGLPFVFAVWMKKRGVKLGGLPGELARVREINEGRVDEIVAKYGREHGWVDEAARDYLTKKLYYKVGEREIAGMREFFARASRLGLIDKKRELEH